MIDVKDIYFSYGHQKILEGVSFSARKGEILALIGVSGSGKTTLFKLLTGLIAPLKGTIILDTQPFSKGALLTTYMRQDDLLLPWRTVRGNLLLFAELGKKKQNKAHFIDTATQLLKKMGLEHALDLYPKELSGGMRQRVSLARSLLQNRPIMLLDEPFASLDVILREQLYILLRDLRDQYQKTILMVTHDFRDAMALADRILVLSNGKIKGNYLLPNCSLSPAPDQEHLIQQIRHDLLAHSEKLDKNFSTDSFFSGSTYKEKDFPPNGMSFKNEEASSHETI